MSSFSKLVQYFLRKQQLSEAEFADELNKALPNQAWLSAAVIENWARIDIEPATSTFREIILYFGPGHRDWRIEFAVHALAIIDPKNWDYDSGRGWEFCVRMTKTYFLNIEGAKAQLAEILEAQHV